MVEAQKGLEARASTLGEQYKNLKRVMNTDVSDIEKQRQMHKELEDGQALEVDEKLSMSLEDKMAGVIQRGMKRALGRAIRKAILAKMNIAAQLIQNLVRKKANEGLSYDRGVRLTLATKVQKLFRGQGGKDIAKQMGLKQAIKNATDLLVRVARGMLARSKTRRKRLFIRSVALAKEEVSLEQLSPDDLDYLADIVENYIKDYTAAIPMEAMTILRAIFYMMNGQEDEDVTVDNAGFVETVSLYPNDAGWNGYRLLLRRKGRFLRRIRQLVDYISIPSPRKLVFDDVCLKHLNIVQRRLNPIKLNVLDKRSKKILMHFYNYIINVKISFDLQSEFPEYFIPVQPNWFRLSLRYQLAYQNALATQSVNNYVKIKIDAIREKYKEKGKAWKHVFIAAEKNKEDLKANEERVLKVLANCEAHEKAFKIEEDMRMVIIDGFMDAREVGVQVSKRDFDAFFLKEGDTASEARISEMRLAVDRAELLFLQSQNSRYFALKSKVRDLKARDFSTVLKMGETRALCKREGMILGGLMVLQEVWEDFVNSIGGMQYVKDLKDSELKYYLDTRKEVETLLVERRGILLAREAEIAYQFKRCADIAHEARLGEFHNTWDVPTDMEKAAEKLEDKECRGRDADLDAKAARAAKRLRIPAGKS